MVSNNPRSKLPNLFVDLMDCSRQSTGPANKKENETKGYQIHEFSSTDEALIQKHGPLLFFKENSSKFPLLSNLAKAVFCAMP